MISVVVADDHLMVRDALVALLKREADLQVLAWVSDGEQLLERVESLGPDVAVLDVEMPRMTGIEAVRQLRDRGLRTAAVLLSVHQETGFVKAALDAGASGYVLKAAGAEELLTAIRVAAAGDTYLSPRITSAALGAMGAPHAPAAQLTPLERDVLRLLARGLSSKEMAAELDISSRTVDEYRARLMDKLGVRHVPGLVKCALRSHLTTLDD